jgi:hypothetical protein
MARRTTRRWIFEADSVVGDLRVIRPVGRGGMGEVYLARDTRLGRKVALKVVHPDVLGSRSALERFLFEARVTARFSHPNITPSASWATTGPWPWPSSTGPTARCWRRSGARCRWFGSGDARG